MTSYSRIPLKFLHIILADYIPWSHNYTVYMCIKEFIKCDLKVCKWLLPWMIIFFVSSLFAFLSLHFFSLLCVIDRKERERKKELYFLINKHKRYYSTRICASYNIIYEFICISICSYNLIEIMTHLKFSIAISKLSFTLFRF